jgi:hypothetical protein
MAGFIAQVPGPDVGLVLRVEDVDWLSIAELDSLGSRVQAQSFPQYARRYGLL